MAYNTIKFCSAAAHLTNPVSNFLVAPNYTDELSSAATLVVARAFGTGCPKCVLLPPFSFIFTHFSLETQTHLRYMSSTVDYCTPMIPNFSVDAAVQRHIEELVQRRIDGWEVEGRKFLPGLNEKSMSDFSPTIPANALTGRLLEPGN